MQIKRAVIVAVVAVLGVVLVAFVMRGGAGDEAAAVEAGPADYPRGPHRGRLLTGTDLQVEVTLYETGVPPQFRVFVFDGSGKPVPPRDVQLAIELHRLGGRVDKVGFRPEADYLRGDAEVEEPHSFDVKIKATRGGRAHDFAYSQIEGRVRLAPEAIKSAGIEILTAGPRQMVTTVEVPGEIVPDATRVAHVVPTLAGVVTDVMKKTGDAVKKGDLLAVMSSRELADARSGYLAAVRQIEFAKARLDREESLWKKKISAEQDYLEARRIFDEARLTREVAAQKLVALGAAAGSLAALESAASDQLPRHEIRAPLDGTVVERDVTIGEAVGADQAIFVVADLSSVWVEATITAKDLGFVREGQGAVVRSADLGREQNGRVSYIAATVGKETRSATARIVIANPGGVWRPGLFVSVRLVQQSQMVPFAVLAEAIHAFRDWQVVFVKYGDWFEARPLELGRSDGVWVEVKSGLEPGVQYVGKNSFTIKAEIGKLGASHDH